MSNQKIIPLSPSVNQIMNSIIAAHHNLSEPDPSSRKLLSDIGEAAAIDVLSRISKSATIATLDGYIRHMVTKYRQGLLPPSPSPNKRTFSSCSTENASCESPAAKKIMRSPSSSCKGEISGTIPHQLCESPGPKQFYISKNASNGSLSLTQYRSLPSTSVKGASPGSTPPRLHELPVPNVLVQPQLASHDSLSLKKMIHSPSNKRGSPGSISQELHDQSPSSNYFVPSPHSGSKQETCNVARELFASPTPQNSSNSVISKHLLLLSELEFRKMFMVLSYIGSTKLEEAHAIVISEWKNKPMFDFESRIWNYLGCKNCQQRDRARYVDWDSGKAHRYFCHVSPDGSYTFKGPFLNVSRTHLQRSVGDDNLLIVKFVEAQDSKAIYKKIAEDGILVGIRRYRFFAFKDGGREEKKSRKQDNWKTANSCSIKCYFIRRESDAPWIKDSYLMSQKPTVHMTRCLFMHVHTVASIAKYIARFSLILSQTVKLDIDLGSVNVERIEDIPCRDELGHVVVEDGEPLIHTEGTGFISEDLALKCPKKFKDAKNVKDENFEIPLELKGAQAFVKEPPLLIQCRLFKNGIAVKGTLLVNKKLPERTIQIRPSMIKVEKDLSLPVAESFNSLEMVAISHKPRNALLSRNLISLLSIGGVPKEYFLNLVDSALADAQTVYSSTRAAARVAMSHGEIDDGFTSLKMIGAEIPLYEPYLRYRLSQLAIEERKGLGAGKLPISESYYLMGTADPTGILNSNQVCVILDNDHLSGKVLVYRNPGLHFGDIHVLEAVPVPSLDDFVGNSKYGIFFSSKGRRSMAAEIANGDFDGDMYWVCKNRKLMSYFKASQPWKRMYSSPSPCSKKPSDFNDDELERELFNQLLDSKNQSNLAGIASDSWMHYMDRLLTLGDDAEDEKHQIKEKILKLVDLYYDALDAPKSGKTVVIPPELKAEVLPHYLGRGKEYRSTSILGQIHDRVRHCQTEKLTVKEMQKLPCFDVTIPEACKSSWEQKYHEYRNEMSSALSSGDESRNESANSVIKKYKQMLYEAPEFEESTRKIEDIYTDALAIYHVTYDYASIKGDIEKCRFAWRVAGSALCSFCRTKKEVVERSIPFSLSILKDVLC